MLRLIHRLVDSKKAIMDGDGYIATVGKFLNVRGLMFSNASYEAYTLRAI